MTSIKRTTEKLKELSSSIAQNFSGHFFSRHDDRIAQEGVGFTSINLELEEEAMRDLNDHSVVFIRDIFQALLKPVEKDDVM